MPGGTHARAKPLPARIASPLESFLGAEAVGGVLLLIATAAALLWANIDEGSYADFWGTRASLALGGASLDLDLHAWVNDALMAVFFYVVGLEIKREVVAGELADSKRRALPVAAALGGMAVPAAVYLAFNASGPGRDGWAIPMATDIAFAAGIFALVGRALPISLRVFLVALAIVDDMGAIAVIAVFYSDAVEVGWLAAAGGLLGVSYALGRAGVRDLSVFVVLAAAAWVAVHESGVHATVVGVAFGLLTPTAMRRSESDARLRELSKLVEEGDHGALREIEEIAREEQPLLDRLEHALHPWSSYVIVPLFALANAGVSLGGGAVGDAVDSRVTLGVVAGLAVGKPAGILALSWLAVRTRVAVLPEGVRWGEIVGAALVAGIGFTVSLFIADLAFDDARLAQQARIGIIVGSGAMAVAGLAVLGAMAARRGAAADPGAREEATA